jgi:hypothetical protein
VVALGEAAHAAEPAGEGRQGDRDRRGTREGKAKPRQQWAGKVPKKQAPVKKRKWEPSEPTIRPRLRDDSWRPF